MLGIWATRSYNATSNPFFPFAQNIFPTPKYWSGESIEYNFMIQSKVTVKDWLTGSAFIYPYRVYKNTSQFAESTETFSGFFPLIFILSFIFASIFFIKSKQKTSEGYMVLICFLCYFCVGIATRYYRYLFPFMVVSTILSIYFLLKNKFISKKILVVVCLMTTITNLIYTRDYYKTQGIEFNNLLNPSAYSQPYVKFLNMRLIYAINKYTNNNPNIKTLDISSNTPGRLLISGHTFQCNWYWTGLDTDILKNKSKNDIKTISESFDIYITDNTENIKQAEPLKRCNIFIPDNKKLIYKDYYYNVYTNEN